MVVDVRVCGIVCMVCHLGFHTCAHTVMQGGGGGMNPMAAAMAMMGNPMAAMAMMNPSLNPMAAAMMMGGMAGAQAGLAVPAFTAGGRASPRDCNHQSHVLCRSSPHAASPIPALAAGMMPGAMRPRIPAGGYPGAGSAPAPLVGPSGGGGGGSPRREPAAAPVRASDHVKPEPLAGERPRSPRDYRRRERSPPPGFGPRFDGGPLRGGRDEPPPHFFPPGFQRGGPPGPPFRQVDLPLLALVLLLVGCRCFPMQPQASLHCRGGPPPPFRDGPMPPPHHFRCGLDCAVLLY